MWPILWLWKWKQQYIQYKLSMILVNNIFHTNLGKAYQQWTPSYVMKMDMWSVYLITILQNFITMTSHQKLQC